MNILKPTVSAIRDLVDIKSAVLKYTQEQKRVNSSVVIAGAPESGGTFTFADGTDFTFADGSNFDFAEG